MPGFVGFPKISRLSREIVITEKLDGTNAQIVITDSGDFFTGSRNRWVTPGDDNYGFARWAYDNRADLMKLGPGQHFGEWWGAGIQRRYGLTEKRFSLFNTGRWRKQGDGEPMLEGQAFCPDCCHVVPVLYTGPFDTNNIDNVIYRLRSTGSAAVPGFMKPEGIVLFHTASRQLFKKTLENDASPKGVVA